jgi:DNA gyrase inhibitor GyrI
VPELRVTLKHVDSLFAAVLPMTGSYAQHEDAITRLMAYVADTAQVATLSPPFGRYFTDPSQVEETALRWEVGVEVTPAVDLFLPFLGKTIPGGWSATATVSGPYDSVGTAWPRVLEWVAAHGYLPAGPPMELWLGGEGPKTELRLPVSKAAPTPEMR